MRRLRWVLAGSTSTLLVTLFVASTAYAVLSATTETSRLSARGTISDNAATAAYDILVRPRGAISGAEQDLGLVQPGFLGATGGGISMQQWRQIEGIAGVEVAAPVAVLGWVVPYVSVPVDLGDVIDTTTPVVVHRTITWSYDNGASELVSAPALLYVTPNPVVFDFDRQVSIETRPDGTEVVFTLPGTRIPQTVEEQRQYVQPVSTRDLVQDGGGQARTNVDVAFPFPFLVSAVDPDAEAELSGVEGALVDGQWLDYGAPDPRTFAYADGAPDDRRAVPVVVASEPLMRLTARHEAVVLDGPDVRRIAEQGFTGTTPPSLLTDTGRQIDSGTYDQDAAYADFIDAMATPEDDGDYYARSVLKLHRTSPLKLRTRPDGTLAPAPVPTDLGGWGSQDTPGDVVDSIVPPSGDDAQFRTLDGFSFTGPKVPPAGEPLRPPALVKVGVFDAEQLPGTTSLARVPLGTFAFAAPQGADAASRSSLGDEDWYPAANVAGYVQPPPLMLTSLDSLAAFADTTAWVRLGPGDDPQDSAAAPRTAPITGPPLSAVRIRVEGVDGVDALDRERVRLVAEEIAESTGLAVDITLGSSPGPRRVEVAPGTRGRPELTITEVWVAKGVAVELVRGIDRLSVLLSLVVLVAAALVVLDAVYASVRARRREIGILLSLGWSPWHVGGRVLLPLLLAALVAGSAAAGAALVLRGLLDLDRDVLGALTAVPAAVAIAVLAAIGPAVAAARTSPIDATRAPARRSGRRRLRRTRSVLAIATNSVVLSPGRTAAAGVGVAIAAAAVGSLLAVQAEFQGQAAGTLLGDAIAVQVRTPDVVAALLTLVLAGFGVHHVMATEIRERRSELATLRAVGWRDSTIARLLLLQAALVASLGATAGGLAAWLFLGEVFETRSLSMVAALAAAGAAGVAIAVAVTLLPIARLRTASVGQLLTED